MICPHCHREQKGNDRHICMFCKRNLQPESSAPANSPETIEIQISELRVKCHKGDMRACYRLGLFYFQGKGVERSLETAVDYFTQAAQSGLADAQYALALCQLQGKGAPQNIAQALKNLAAAARQNHSRALKLIKDIQKTGRAANMDTITLIKDITDCKTDQPIHAIQFLPQDSATTCPGDQYALTRCQGELAYYTLDPLQLEGYLRLTLLQCPHCHTWYINQTAIHHLSQTEYDLEGIDIVGFPEHPRIPELAALHRPAEAASSQHKPSGRRRTGRSSGRRSSSHGLPEQQHLAIKLVSCDGGRTEKFFGFRGLCSDAHYQQHRRTRDVPWCSSSKNHCREWTSDQLENQDYPCLECHLLQDWCLGSPQDGANDSPGHRIAGDRTGSLALLTTLEPGQPESERRVFAIFQIAPSPDLPAGAIVAQSDKRLELMLDEPVRFWEHYELGKPIAEPRWGSVFYRNLQSDQVASVLRQAAELIHESERKNLAQVMLDQLGPVAAS